MIAISGKYININIYNFYFIKFIYYLKIAWTLVLVFIIVKILEKKNLLRPSLEVEERGFDNLY